MSLIVEGQVHKFRKRQNRGPGFTCVFCNKQFKGTTCEKIHLRRHIGEKPYMCQLCGFAASCLTDVTTHQRRTHSMYTVMCYEDKCRKVFKSEFAMKNHYKLVHTNLVTSKASCDICGKVFRQQGTLTSHMRLHTGEKPFKCPVCDKVFTQQSTLNTHFRVHTGEKRFQCLKCKKRFKTKQYLQTHEQKVQCSPPPEPYTCRVCRMEFDFKKDLKEHRKTVHPPQKDKPMEGQQQNASSGSGVVVIKQQGAGGSSKVVVIQQPQQAPPPSYPKPSPPKVLQQLLPKPKAPKVMRVYPGKKPNQVIVVTMGEGN